MLLLVFSTGRAFLQCEHFYKLKEVDEPVPVKTFIMFCIHVCKSLPKLMFWDCFFLLFVSTKSTLYLTYLSKSALFIISSRSSSTNLSPYLKIGSSKDDDVTTKLRSWIRNNCWQPLKTNYCLQTKNHNGCKLLIIPF